MRALLLIISVGFSSTANSQFQPGIYQSVGNSFRLDYFLTITDDSLTFFGWEMADDSDTVYFKSSCKLNKEGAQSFTSFEFSGNKPDPRKPDSFTAREDLVIDSHRLHRHLFNLRQIDRYIHVLATKDIYDSRSDEFLFQKIW